MKDVDLDNIEVTEEDLMDDDLLSELNDVLGMFTVFVCVRVCACVRACV